ILGMTQAYATTNRGPAQEALDGTFNAVVRITGLRPIAPDGPGIELLDYRTPPTRRPAPADTASNDLVHIHLSLRVDALEQEVQSLDGHRARFVSSRNRNAEGWQASSHRARPRRPCSAAGARNRGPMTVRRQQPSQ